MEFVGTDSVRACLADGFVERPLVNREVPDASLLNTVTCAVGHLLNQVDSQSLGVVSQSPLVAVTEATILFQ